MTQGATLERTGIAIESDYPLDKAVCMFYPKQGEQFIGYMDWDTIGYNIRCLEANEWVSVNTISQYRHILNPKGGLYFFKPKQVHATAL
jgi:hypothetical protein